MTMRELFREFVVAKRASKRRVQHDIAVAWQTANFTRAAKLPELDKVLAPTNTPSRQTIKQQRSVLEAISKSYGLTLRKVAQA
jgi:hypothetical protein